MAKPPTAAGRALYSLFFRVGATVLVMASIGGGGSALAKVAPPRPRCVVHGTVLKQGRVPVVYGLHYRDKDEIAARPRLFPNSNKSVGGGCVVGRHGASQVVLYCDLCRTAETAWWRAHRQRRTH